MAALSPAYPGPMLDRPRAAVLGALGCAVALAAVGVLAHLVPGVHRLDANVLDAFTRLREIDVEGVLDTVVHLADPLPYLFFASAIVLLALSRERPHLAIAVAITLVVAPLTAEILKELTAHARSHSVRFADHINRASWPSGHTTGAVTAALCALMVVPRGIRPLVAVVGGLYSLVIGYAVIALVWHFPSDVVGAYALSTGCALLAVAAVRRWPDAEPACSRPRDVAAGTGAAIAAVVFVAVVALSYLRPGQLLDDAHAHTTLFAAGAGIAALAAGAAFVLVRSMSDD